MEIQHYLPSRNWCRKNKSLIEQMSDYPKLRTDNTRLWEYPFVYNILKERVSKKTNIIDIGAGDCAFSNFLKNNEYGVTCVDNYNTACWSDMKKASAFIGVAVVNNNCTELEFTDNQFDAALLVSVIEHVPSNMIFEHKTGKLKKGDEVDREYPIRKKVISEALRVIKKGGLLILTTDMYLDFPKEANLSFEKLMDYKGLEMSDIHSLSDDVKNDLYIVDNPLHKGRVLSFCVVVKKE